MGAGAVTNAGLRRMLAENRDGPSGPLPPLALPDRLPQRVEPGSWLPARDGACEARTVEIVRTPPSTRSGRRLLAALAKALAVPVLLAAGYYAGPVHECRRQKSLGMLYYGTTVEMCIGERMSERAGSVQAFVDPRMRAVSG